MFSLGLGFNRLKKNTYKPYINYSWATSVSSDYITDGVELVTNGGFDTDLSGWTIDGTNSTNTIEWEDGKLKLVNTDTNIGFSQDILEIGGTYIVTITAEYINGTIALDGIVTGTNIEILEGTNTYIIENVIHNRFKIKRLSNGTDVYVDNISVQKVIQKPNEVVSKNIGSGKVPVKWYSGNPMDFQGSQSIPVNITIGREFSITVSGIFNSYILGSSGTLVDVFSVGYNTNQVRFRLRTSYQYVWDCDVANTQTTLTISANDSTISLYKDGVLVSTQNRIENITSITFTSIGEVGNSYLDGQLDHLVIYNGILTPTQIQQSYTNPNAFYYEMVKGASSANTLFATDFGGTGGYIADDKNKSTVEKIPTYKYTTFGNPVGTSSYNNGVLSVEVTTVGTTNYQPLCIFTIPTTLSGTYREITINYTVNSGTCIISNYNDGSNTSLNKTLSGSGSYTFIDLCANDSSTVRFDLDGRNLFNIDFSIEVKEISGIYPITNYSSTMRTNFQTEPTGLQDILIERDSLGFFLGLREFPKGNGVGYADTGYVISGSEEELSLEIVIKPKVETYYHKYVQSEVNKLTIQTFPNVNTLAFYWFSENMNFTFMEDIPYVFTLVKDSVSSSLYVNGVLTVTKDVKQFSSIRNVVLFTEYDTHNYCPSGEIGLFKVHQKALTQEEITENYNYYKSIPEYGLE